MIQREEKLQAARFLKIIGRKVTKPSLWAYYAAYKETQELWVDFKARRESSEIEIIIIINIFFGSTITNFHYY